MDAPRLLEGQKPAGEDRPTEVTLRADQPSVRPPLSDPPVREAPSLLSPPVTLYQHNTTQEAKEIVYLNAAERFAKGDTICSGTGFGMADYSVEEPKKNN